MAPVWHQIADLYSNSDYFGNQIHPIHGSNTEALTDPATYSGVGKYIASSSAPFSVTNFNQRRAQGEGVISSLSSSAAILSAPKWVGRTKAQELAYNLYATKMTRGPNDPDVSARIQRYHQLASGYAANQFTEQDVKTAYDKGQITLKQYDGILNPTQHEGNLSPLARHTKQLNPGEFIRVWDMASQDERSGLLEQFTSKYNRIEKDYPEQDAKTLLQHFERSYKLYKK